MFKSMFILGKSTENFCTLKFFCRIFLQKNLIWSNSKQKKCLNSY